MVYNLPSEEREMALNIKDPETERLAAEVATLTGESKTKAVRKALEERRERLVFQVVRRRAPEERIRFLEREIWSAIPPSKLGKRTTRKEKERILGYGPEGV